jgi:sodium/pantothenate symporter
LDIYTTTIAISIIIYIAIGNYAGRGIKRLDDYYVAGRRAPTLIIVGTLVASLMSTTMFLGEAGFAYNGQAGPYVIFPQVTAVGYVIGAILFGRYLRRSRATTVAEFFGKRFASPRVQAVAGFTIVFALGGYLLAVTQGAAILLSQLTELGYVQAVVIAWLSYTAFTMYSGSRGVILTDTLMFLLFTFASIAAIVFLLVYFGGWPTMIEDLVAIEEKPELMSWHGVVGPGTIWPTPMDYLIWTMVIDISWLIVVAVSPWQASRHLMAIWHGRRNQSRQSRYRAVRKRHDLGIVESATSVPGGVDAGGIHGRCSVVSIDISVVGRFQREQRHRSVQRAR